MPVDVAVVGGGIAGLATAYELSRRGVSFVVLERGLRAGGVILSETVDGFTIDGGPDALLVQKPEGIALCRELGIGDRLIPTTPPRLAFVQRGGKLHAIPAASVLGIPTRIGPFVRTGLFTWAGKLRMGAEIAVPRRRDSSDESIGAFMRRRVGEEATAYLAEPLLAGIHAGDVDRLSVNALFPRFVEAERKHGSLLRAFRSQSAATPPAKDGAFRSFPGGLSELTRAIVKAIGQENIRTGSAVVGIDGAGPFRVNTSDGAIDARAAVLATPAFATAELLRPRDEALAALCAGVPYASTATIVLAFRRAEVAHALNGSGFVVPRVEDHGIMAATWLSSKWAGRAPEDIALMRAFVGGARDPHALEKSDAELIERSVSALAPLLGISGRPMMTRVYRWERASAQYEVGHLERVAAIDRALTRHRGIFITGSGFRGVGIPDCVADGRNTARQVAEWLRS